MKKIENGNFHHTLLSALSCVLLMAVAGGICSLDSLVFSILIMIFCVYSLDPLDDVIYIKENRKDIPIMPPDLAL